MSGIQATAEQWYELNEGWKESAAIGRFAALSARVAKASVRTVAGHSKNVNSLAWSPSGSRLASGSDDRTARVWAPDDGSSTMKQTAKLDGHSDSVTQLCWSPMGGGGEAASINSLATLAADRTVRIWDTRAPARPAHAIALACEYINLAWSPDGRFLAVGSNIGGSAKDDLKDSVTVLDVRAASSPKTKGGGGGDDGAGGVGRVVKKWKFPCEINELCWAPDSSHVILTTEHGTLELMRLSGGGEAEDSSNGDAVRPSEASVCSIAAHTDHCYCIEVDPTRR